MTPERWQQIKSLFDGVLACATEQRDAFLDSACRNDSELRREVTSLLAAYSDAGERYDQPLLEGDPLIGRHAGVYRILRRLGSGGMGAVYLAARDDDQFRRLVAVKAIRPELLDERTRRRFQNERHTMAALEHPNIVKLLDGGMGEDGMPYLVMDYVEGQPIDRYCKDRNLSVRERLELFRTLCCAVHYAHQNLVVHRDLKPANILVTPQGIPKLLDFGIAKLLRPEYAAGEVGYTRTAAQPMTPEFASPEQILGQPVTTASDIYSLGVLLFVLLTGKHPFAPDTQSAHHLERAICEGSPPKPSEAAVPMARQFRGDLDTIALKAMRKEPQRRYASAEHLAEDIRLYLAGEPVTARGETVFYRAGKFLKRRRTAAISTAAAGTLLAGLAVKDHRDGARAARRFEDLRSLANWVINDLDAKMRTSMIEARKEVAGKATTYLDNLARDAGSDAVLQSELVLGYLKTSDIQGNRFVPNLGQTAAARTSAAKALAIAEEVARHDPGNAESRKLLSRCHEKFGDVLGEPAERQQALGHYQSALDLAGHDPPRRMTIWTKVQQIRSDANDPAGAMEASRGIERDALDWQAQAPDEPRARSAVAFARERMAWFALLAGESAADAENNIRSAIQTYEASLAANPSAGKRRNIAKAYKTLAEIQKRLGKIPQALENCRKSLRESEQLLGEDPRNDLYGVDVAQGFVLLVRLLLAGRSMPEARMETARAIRYLEPRAVTGNSSTYLIDYVTLLVETPFPDWSSAENAVGLARRAVDLTNGTDPETLDLLARALARGGRRDEAVASEQKAIALLPPQPPGRPTPEMRRLLEENLSGLERTARASAGR